MMKRRHLVLIATVAAFSFVGTQSSALETGEMVTTGLLNMPLEDIAGKESNVVLFEVGPGWTIDRHFHPGHIFLYMIEGSIMIEIDGLDAQTLLPGEATYEIPNLNMVANNVSSTEGAKFVAFTVGNTGDEVMIFPE